MVSVSVVDSKRAISNRFHRVRPSKFFVLQSIGDTSSLNAHRWKQWINEGKKKKKKKKKKSNFLHNQFFFFQGLFFFSPFSNLFFCSFSFVYFYSPFIIFFPVFPTFFPFLNVFLSSSFFPFHPFFNFVADLFFLSPNSMVNFFPFSHFKK